MSADRPPSLEEAFERFVAARRSGSTESGQAFAARFPHLGAELLEALEVYEVLDQPDLLAPSSLEELPERIANFRVVREIGRGGMGVVLEAVEEPLERRVALKILPAEFLASASARARFKREAEVASRLDHSGIATVYGAGVESERPWIAMRYVEGRTLAALVADARENGRPAVELPGSEHVPAPVAIAHCFAEIARALQFAHERGVVHRDIKPSNVIIAPDGTPTLVDFGLAILDSSSGHTLTRTGETAGTPAYFAPEIVGGEIGRHDVQTDVYALGVSLFECLTTRRPFDGPTPVALYRAIASGTATSPRALNRGVSRDLAVVVATAMERDRGRRYAGAARMAEDLEAACAGRPIAARPVPWTGRVARWARREPRQAVLAGLFALAALVSAALLENWWISRRVVQAAEQVARVTQREAGLGSGFAALEALDVDAAEREFERVIAIEPRNEEAHAGLAFVAYARGHDDRARAALATMPDTPGFRALQAFLRRERVTGDEEALNSSRTTAEDFFLLGVTLVFESGHGALSARKRTNERALRMLNEAVIRTPTARLVHHLKRAWAAGETSNAAVARSASGALLALWPDSYNAVFQAGACLSPIDPEASLAVLERAARMNPADAAPPQILGTTLDELGRHEEAEPWLQRACALRPRNVECRNSLGVNFATRGCMEDAGSAFERAAAADPTHEWAAKNVAMFAAMSGDWERSAFLFERLLQRDPTNSEYFAYEGIALRELGRANEARACLEAAVGLGGALPEVYVELFYACSQLKDRPAARAVLAEGLLRVPGFPPLVEIQKKIESLR